MSGRDGTTLTEDESDIIQLIRQAVLFENVELLSDLIRENPWSLMRVDQHGRTPLMLAAHNGRLDSLKTLLNVDCDTLNSINCAGKTALHLAAEAGEVLAVRQLLLAGADTECRDLFGHCALESAHIAGHDNVAAVIIETIQLKNDKLNEAHTELICACAENDVSTIEKILTHFSIKDQYILLNGHSPGCDTALFIACINGQVDVVKRLLELETDHVVIDPVTKDTIIHTAISSQNVEMLKIMLEAFPMLVANVNSDGCSCLHWAAESGSTEIMRSLLEFHYPENLIRDIDLLCYPPYRSAIDVNQGDIECRTALYRAVAKGYVEVIQYMLAFQCLFCDGEMRCPFQLDVYCSRGRTPLMVAAYNQSLPILTMLLDAGADVNLPLAILDYEKCDEARCVGSGALLEATRSDAIRIVNFLHDRGAVDTDNRALRLAVKNKNFKLVRVFLTRLVFPDPEFKVNKKNVDVGQIHVGSNLLPSSLCPSRAAMLNWSSASLRVLQSDWFIAAALQINPRLRTTKLSLAAITRVDLSHNQLTDFPSILLQMPSLRSLNLSENHISGIDMPGFYVTSTSLENLNLKQNRLSSISPQFLSSLPQLEILDLSQNCLTQLPEFIWSCPSLKELNVASNNLHSLPIGSTSASRSSRGIPLAFSPTSPTAVDAITISDTIEEPANVTTKALIRQNVWQSEINLSKVDEDISLDFPIASSSTLITLNLSANKFQLFPLCLACTCPRLLSLNISFNQLTSLPPIQCIPAHIRNLDFSGNMIKESFQQTIPLPTLCYAFVPLSSLNSVSVRRLTSPVRQNRSRSKSAVRSQRSLSVSRHQNVDIRVEETCYHRQHDTLEWLKTLNISSNQLETIPVCVNNKILFQALTVLDASSNSLKSVTKDIARLSSLSVLNLAKNKDIHTLPPELGMLTRLWSLSLKGCQLKDPLDSMVNTENCKTIEIIAYLKTILEDSKTYHHLRLMILGSDGVGKSQLWEALRAEAVQKKPVVQGESIRIAEWQYEMKKQKDFAFGPIAYSSWDFTGQREYYSTYHYFLTRRALYVVVWRVSDGDIVFNDIQRWLISIQARAPNACVILVGTHVDQVSSNPAKFPHDFLDEVEKKIRSRFMRVDADKYGLPRVLELLLINAKARSDIKYLLNTIYSSSWEVKIGKDRALDQQIPSSYITMLKVIRELHSDLRRDSTSAIMKSEQFRECMKQRMVLKFGRVFRDDIEFHGICAFLHDTGEVVHFEDSSLRELIFVDPLWLADYLAAIVALRSPNRPAGILFHDAMVPLLKKFHCIDSDTPLRGALLDLLQKYELALPCTGRKLLVPALLPDEYRLRSDYLSASVKIFAKLPWTIRFNSEIITVSERIGICPKSLDHPSLSAVKPVIDASKVVLTFSIEVEKNLRRLYAMSYIPAGFWSRITTRIIGDKNVMRAVECLFATNKLCDVARLQCICDSQLKAEWVVWQTGIELNISGHSVFLLRQFLLQTEIYDLDYTNLILRTRDEQERWQTFPLDQYALIEAFFPSLSIAIMDGSSDMVLSTECEGVTGLLALVVDILDTMLEDWYPALGTRFVHSSEGDLLVNRLVPCSKCSCEVVTKMQANAHSGNSLQKDTIGFQCYLTVDSFSHRTEAVQVNERPVDNSPLEVYCFSAEECMLAGRGRHWLECPIHGSVDLKDLAPETIFVDIRSSLIIPSDQIRRGRLLGRGAFGFVFKAAVKLKNGELCEVAQKMLEPVDPGPGARPTALAAYKAAADKWRRDSLEFASRAYCVSRQEHNLLSRLRHPHITGLVGVCISPLSLIVELAPLGALNQLLSSHRKSGARLGLSVFRDSAVQVAKALEYLHTTHIIYRDLKSENVLAWRFPPPFSSQVDVLLKLGDYGISRAVMPSGGAKGFGGTEGFMAPEIVKFNGEEEYTQKVDCFSYGMFLYELITLKHPFEGEEHVKERLLEGSRPAFLPHELLIPSPILDLVVHCWASLPANRPSSSQIVGYCSAPEFTHLLDICELEEISPPSSVLSYHTGDEMGDPDDFEAQLWLCGSNVTVMSCTQFGWLDQKVIEKTFPAKFSSRIRDTIWLCDVNGEVNVFASSLHQLSQLQLPYLSTSLVRAPELIGFDVLLVVTEQQLILLRLNETNSTKLLATLNSPFVIKGAVVVTQTHNRQIWTGHPEGRISIHHLCHEDKFSFSSSLYLPEEDVSIKDMVASRLGNNVWVTYERGSRVFCWDVERRQICSSLDIRKVMPGSETIHTLDIDLAEENFVTCIALLENHDNAQLYVGTSKGLLVVANALLLQPLLACRPYYGELTSLCIVEAPRDDEYIKGRTTLSTTSSESGLSWVRERVSETLEKFRSSPAPSAFQSTAVVVTIGRAYRSLSHRFVSLTSLQQSCSIAIWRTEEWL